MLFQADRLTAVKVLSKQKCTRDDCDPHLYGNKAVTDRSGY